MYSTRVSWHVRAPRPAVYRALLDAGAIAKWRVPDGMSSRVHEFDAREGGSFRISLSYDAPAGTGKSAPRTDTYHGHFVRLVPDQQVVEVFEFETADPELRGQMTMTTTLTWHWQISPGSSRQLIPDSRHSRPQTLTIVEVNTITRAQAHYNPR